MKLKLKAKVFMLMTATLIVTIGIIWILFREASLWILPGYNQLVLQEMGGELAERLAGVHAGDREAIAREIEAFIREHDGIGIELFDRDGTLLYSYAGRTAPGSPQEALERFANPFQRVFFRQDASLIYKIDANGETRFVVFDVRGDMWQPVQFFLYIGNWAVYPFFLGPLFLIIVLPALTAFLFIWWTTRRLKRLNRAMQRVDLSGDPVLLVDKSKDEISELTKLFNEMTLKLHDQYRRIRQIEKARSKLVSQLSHDLRTPSSIIRGYAETLLRGPVHDRDAFIRHATIILQKTDYMDDLLRKLFSLAQLEDPSKAFRKRQGYLDSLLQTIMADYVLILQDKDMEWHLDLPAKPFPAAFDPDGLSQAIRNLIDNAILHGSDGKYLGVRLIPAGDKALIEVEDRGKGIPPHDMERIFEPFFRADRGRPSDGLGVGLTLADAVVRRHGGVIEVSSKPYVSNVFRVILPVGQAASDDETGRSESGPESSR